MSAVAVERDGQVAIVTLDRPDKLNALNRAVVDGLLEALDATRDARAVLLRGAGRAFCAGADLHAVRDDHPGGDAAWLERVADLHERLRLAPVPVVASVHGYALGAGLSLALVCDFVLCAEDAVLGLPEVEHGLVAGISMVYLRDVAGAAVARELVLSGRRVTGTEAAALGIAGRALPAGELEAAARTLAGRLAELRPDAVRLTKRLIHETAGLPLAQQLAAARTAVLVARRSREARAGAEAFAQRERA